MLRDMISMGREAEREEGGSEGDEDETSSVATITMMGMLARSVSVSVRGNTLRKRRWRSAVKAYSAGLKPRNRRWA